MHPAESPRGDASIPVDTDKIVGRSRLLGEMRDLIRRKHYSIRTVQELLGHKDVRTTMIYTHVMNKRPLGVKSPLTRLTGF